MLIDTSIANYDKYKLRTEERVYFNSTTFKQKIKEAKTTIKEVYAIIEPPFGYKNVLAYIKKGQLPKSLFDEIADIVPAVIETIIVGTNLLSDNDNDASDEVLESHPYTPEMDCEEGEFIGDGGRIEVPINDFNDVSPEIVKLLEKKIEEWHEKNDTVTVTDKFGLSVTMPKGDFITCWRTLVKSNIRISYIYNGFGFDRDPMYKAPIYHVLVTENVSIETHDEVIELKYGTIFNDKTGGCF